MQAHNAIGIMVRPNSCVKEYNATNYLHNVPHKIHVGTPVHFLPASGCLLLSVVCLSNLSWTRQNEVTVPVRLSCTLKKWLRSSNHDRHRKTKEHKHVHVLFCTEPNSWHLNFRFQTTYFRKHCSVFFFVTEILFRDRIIIAILNNAKIQLLPGACTFPCGRKSVQIANILPRTSTSHSKKRFIRRPKSIQCHTSRVLNVCRRKEPG